MTVLDRRCLLSVGRIGAMDQPHMGTTFGVEVQRNQRPTEWWVTAAHVIEAIRPGRIPLITGKNSQTGQVETYTFPEGPGAWTLHPEWENKEGSNDKAYCDVAVAPLYRDLLKKTGGAWTCFGGDWLTEKRELKTLGVAEGTAGYVLGFPGGAIDPSTPMEWHWPAVRSAIIAQIQPWYTGQTRLILAESMASPGNSGSPMVTAPETYSIDGPQPDRSILLGMVTGGRLRNGEEIGLAIVVPWPEIETAIDTAIKNG